MILVALILSALTQTRQEGEKEQDRQDNLVLSAVLRRRRDQEDEALMYLQRLSHMTLVNVVPRFMFVGPCNLRAG